MSSELKPSGHQADAGIAGSLVSHPTSSGYHDAEARVHHVLGMAIKDGSGLGTDNGTEASSLKSSPVLKSDGTFCILVVDDDPRIRASLPRILRGWGWDTITASDGLDALERIQHSPEIGLVISDVDMPRLSGPGLIEWLSHRRPEIPAILISGCDLDESQRAKIPMDVPVLVKPVYPEILRARLQQMLFSQPEAVASA